MWHNLKKEAVIRKLGSSEKGISDEEAGRRLEKYGKNIIEKKQEINPWKIFFLQFKSWLIYILLAAIIVSIVIEHYIDASVILAIVILNAFIGFSQQYKAEKSISKLKKILSREVKILRGGKLKVLKVSEIVPGDILILKEGDKVPADSRILEAESLEVNEAVLTGESMPVRKKDLVIEGGEILAERKNMVYTGTNIVRGRCKCIIVGTGMKTEFGKIAGELQEIRLQETPMQKKMDKFAKQVSVLVVLLSVLILIIGVIFNQEIYNMFLTAIALAVSAIPEGLPAVITIGLAFATKSMAKEKTIIRRLPAAESLGSVTVICADKTGTMTEGKMSVKEVYANKKMFFKKEKELMNRKNKIDIKDDKILQQLFKTSVLCNNARFEKTNGKYEIIGEATESALIAAGLDLGFNRKTLTEQEKRVKEISFSSERKMMSIVRKNRREIVYSKGAPEKIVFKSKFEYVNGEIIKIDERRKKELLKYAEYMENRALRVLGFAFKIYKGGEIEDDLIFLGFIGMQDPPRQNVKDSISLCKKAGIKVKMLTGDSELTARAIGKQIGISGEMISGKQLKLMDDKELIKKIDKIEIFARIEPKQKLRIVELLKSRDEEVAVTGDGVNDVLALKRANIGVAMGIRGSDVAREVSDMVLLDDDFSSIVKAVEEGRKVYDNSKKITKYFLTVNFSEILLIAVAIIFGFPFLPLLPIHILWMNLITDSLPAMALIKEKPESVMRGKPRKEKSILDKILIYVLIGGFIAFLVGLIIFLIAINKYPDNSEKVWTLVLTGDVLFEMFLIFSIKSSRKIHKADWTNKWVILGVLSAIIIQIIALYTPLASALSLVPLTIKDWLFLLPFGLSGFILFEIAKFFKK